MSGVPAPPGLGLGGHGAQGDPATAPSEVAHETATQPTTTITGRKVDVVIEESRDGWRITAKRFTAMVNRCWGTVDGSGYECKSRDCLGHRDRVLKLAEKVKATFR